MVQCTVHVVYRQLAFDGMCVCLYAGAVRCRGCRPGRSTQRLGRAPWSTGASSTGQSRWAYVGV